MSKVVNENAESCENDNNNIIHFINNSVEIKTNDANNLEKFIVESAGIGSSLHQEFLYRFWKNGCINFKRLVNIFFSENNQEKESHKLHKLYCEFSYRSYHESNTSNLCDHFAVYVNPLRAELQILKEKIDFPYNELSKNDLYFYFERFVDFYSPFLSVTNFIFIRNYLVWLLKHKNGFTLISQSLWEKLVILREESTGNSLLHYACAMSLENCGVTDDFILTFINKLLRFGMDGDVKTYYGITPLYHVIYESDFNDDLKEIICRDLLRFGARVDVSRENVQDPYNDIPYKNMHEFLYEKYEWYDRIMPLTYICAGHIRNLKDVKKKNLMNYY